MKETCYPKETYQVSHTRFGGLIYASDFSTEHRGRKSINGSAIAMRIANDNKFDEHCRKNMENRHRLVSAKSQHS